MCNRPSKGRLTNETSQYGQLKGSIEVDTSIVKKEFKRVAEERVLNGAFAKEFMSLEKNGPGVDKKLEELYAKANESELAKGEARVRSRLGLE